MKYKPFRNLVLVKKIEENVKGNIVLPDQRRKRFIKLEVLDKGKHVNLIEVEKGDIVYAENMYQPLDEKVGLILEEYIFAKEDNESN